MTYRHYRHAINSRRKHIPALREIHNYLGALKEQANFSERNKISALLHLVEDVCQDDFLAVMGGIGIEAYFATRPKMSSRCHGFSRRARDYGVRTLAYSGWDLLRLYVKSRGYCIYCGTYINPEAPELSFDHKLALVNGGENSVDNLVISCRSCNSSKGKKLLLDESNPQMGWER